MTNTKKLFTIGMVVLIMGALSMTAFAASAYSTPAEAAAGVTGKTVEEVVAEKQSTGLTYGQIANEAGKLEQFKAAILEMRKAAIAEKVASGEMTQEEADALISAIEANSAVCDGTGSAGIGKSFGVAFGAGNGTGSGVCDGTGAGAGGNRNSNGNGNRATQTSRSARGQARRGAGLDSCDGTGICVNP